MRKCPKCNKIYDETWKVCLQCGSPLTTVERQVANAPWIGTRQICQNCKKEVEINSKIQFCQWCGKPIIASNATSNVSDEGIFIGLSEYYKEEFKKIYENNEIYKGKWNWAAFWFGAIWALTKGLWLTAIISIGLYIITGGIFVIFYGFILGARGNYIYYNYHVKNKQLAV